MLADARGAMPAALVSETDQKFLSDGLDSASVIVHGRNSHENQPQSPQRRRLIATRKIESVAMVPDQPQALLWNPAGLSLEDAAKMLGVRRGTVAILGGTEIFDSKSYFCQSLIPAISMVMGGRRGFAFDKLGMLRRESAAYDLRAAGCLIHGLRSSTCRWARPGKAIRRGYGRRNRLQ